jgi:hypothetical protein
MLGLQDGGMGVTQYSVFSSANHRYAPSVMAMNDGSYNLSFYKFYNLHYWLHI